MITGRDALFSVEQAITQVRANESQLDGALRSAMAEAERLRGEEAEGFRMLARIKLDAMAREQVIGNIDATERRALGMIQKHRQTLEDARAPPRRDAGRARTRPRRRSTTATRIWPRRSTRSTSCASAPPSASRRTPRGWRRRRRWTPLRRSPPMPIRRPRSRNRTSRPSASPTRTIRSSSIYGRRSTARPRIRAAISCASSIARSRVLVGYQGARANYAMLQEIPARLREHAKEQARRPRCRQGATRRRRAPRARRGRRGSRRSAGGASRRGDEDRGGSGCEDDRRIAADRRRTRARGRVRAKTRPIAGPSICSPRGSPGKT